MNTLQRCVRPHSPLLRCIPVITVARCTHRQVSVPSPRCNVHAMPPSAYRPRPSHIDGSGLDRSRRTRRRAHRKVVVRLQTHNTFLNTNALSHTHATNANLLIAIDNDVSIGVDLQRSSRGRRVRHDPNCSSRRVRRSLRRCPCHWLRRR